MDETAWENFRSKCSSWSLYFLLFILFTWCACCDKICKIKLSNEKFKTEKPPWTEEKKQTSPKKKRKETFLCRKEKKNLSESCEDSLSSLPELSVIQFVLVLIRTFTDSSCHRLFFCLNDYFISLQCDRERKTCCNAMLFLGNPDPEEVCSFIRLAR